MKKSKSFTLIELLIVVAIIGVLGTIAKFSYDGVKENAIKKVNNYQVVNIENFMENSKILGVEGTYNFYTWFKNATDTTLKTNITSTTYSVLERRNINKVVDWFKLGVANTTLVETTNCPTFTFTDTQTFLYKKSTTDILFCVESGVKPYKIEL